MLEIQSKSKKFSVKFPTSLDELTKETFDSITAGVKLPKYHCIVAMCFKTKVFDFVTAMNSNRDSSVAVIPVLAKISEEEGKEINAQVGEKIIINRSSLEMGVHLNLPTMITSNNAKRYFNSDPDLVKAVITKDNTISIDGKMNKQLVAANSPEIIVLEFKIVPVSAISASIANDVDVADPFIEIKQTEANC